MRGLVQRVTQASVTSAPTPADTAEETGRIGPGLVVFVGVTHDDDDKAARRLADKVWHLRIFADAGGAMNASCADVDGQVLVVPQFTLYGETRKGRRPSFVAAAAPEPARVLVEAVGARLRELGATVATGRFQTHMQVSLINDGPVTLLVEV